MGNYIVSARKYRPGTFDSVVGQSHVTNTLKSAIITDQLAHAFLFSGPRGVGKTTCARILAKAINCLTLSPEGEPCNTCESCHSFNEGKSLNIHELDAASNNSVDDIRNLIEQTRYVPTTGKKSVYIIDEVHMLSQAAFNAFLKTLEEPPAHVLFILATTEKHKILPTILSRCQKFDFRRIKVDDISKHLQHICEQEDIQFEYAALQQIGLKADGALRDGLSLFDQLVSFTSKNLTFSSVLENLNILDYDYYFSAVQAIQIHDHKALLLILHEIIEKGFEAKDFMMGLLEHFRNLLVAKSPETIELLETSEKVKTKYLQQSGEIEETFLLHAFNLCTEAESKIKSIRNPRLLVELTLLKLAHLGNAIKLVKSTAGDNNFEKKNPLIQNKRKNAEEVPLAAVNITTTSEEQTVTDINSPEPEKNKVVEADIPPISSADVAVIHANGASPSLSPPIPTKPSPNVSAEFPISQDFSAMQRNFLQKKAQDITVEEPESVQEYALNPKISLDIEAFKEGLAVYVESLKKEDKYSLASTLEHATHQFEHNKWTCLVENSIEEKLLSKEKDILPFLRSRLGVQELFLELGINPNISQKVAPQAYTQEEKLQEMIKKNPTLKELQKIFKTRIIY
ncbi:MAG: DNA polymerase III subunit gamma/tau [Bacteroidota bacterium]